MFFQDRIQSGLHLSSFLGHALDKIVLFPDVAFEVVEFPAVLFVKLDELPVSDAGRIPPTRII